MEKGGTMSKQSSEMGYRLLELIRRNTDEDHPATQAALREMTDHAGEILGDKGTYARRLRNLADALNTSPDGELLPKGEWKIIYPGYRREVGSRQRNGKVYYRQPVSDVEMDFLVQSSRKTHNFTKEEKASLEKRLMEALVSNHYQYPEGAPEGLIIEPDAKVEAQSEVDHLEQIISELCDRIREKQMVTISFRDTDPDNIDQEEPVSVSPYRIVHLDSAYWLIANCHKRPVETYFNPDPDWDLPDPGDPTRTLGFRRTAPWYTDDLSAYRIDLISSVSLTYTDDEPTDIFPDISGMRKGPTTWWTRFNAGRIRKARYNQKIRQKLQKFDDSLPDLDLRHGKDIFLK